MTKNNSFYPSIFILNGMLFTATLLLHFHVLLVISFPYVMIVLLLKWGPVFKVYLNGRILFSRLRCMWKWNTQVIFVHVDSIIITIIFIIIIIIIIIFIIIIIIIIFCLMTIQVGGVCI